jgi:predicted ferric reductase
MHRFVGYIILFLCCLNTVAFWFFSKESLALIGANPLESVSEVIALLGIVLMSLSLLFSTRFHILEDIFGGLDNDYYIHHILGSISFILLVNHPLLLVVKAIPNYAQAMSYLVPNSNIAYTLGILSIYLMVLSFVFVVLIKIPYEKWLWMHRWLVVSYLLGGAHTLLADSDVSHNLLLRTWISLFLLLGFFSSIYILFLYRYFGPKFTYIVNMIERKDTILHMYLIPEGRKLVFKAGQFVFTKFFAQGVSSEMHPFTISSGPWEDTLRVTAKVAGDYTKKMKNIHVGDKVALYGPYGRFGEFFYKSNNDLFFIAGGIGITPFLSMIRYETVYAKARRIFFFYSYHTVQDTAFVQEVGTTVAYAPNIVFIPWNSQEKGHLTVPKIMELSGIHSDFSVLLCGPEKMMLGLKEQFLKHNVPEESVLFENFSYL